jgi:hypothetical protein
MKDNQCIYHILLLTCMQVEWIWFLLHTQGTTSISRCSAPLSNSAETTAEKEKMQTVTQNMASVSYGNKCKQF